jgi:2-polyprenyl-3-methyl-5-hydroxy-6-metoxy-1,4-benzoquinol methylase
MNQPPYLNDFEYIKCPLCGAKTYKQAYCRHHYVNDTLGKVKITNVICVKCGFMYMNPSFKDDVLKVHYRKNSSGDVYHESCSDSRHGKLNSERKRFIEHQLTNVTTGKFLDIACGQGEMLGILDLYSWKKCGLEPSIAPLRTPRNDINIFSTTIQDFSPEIEFEAISCISALEHFVDPIKCLRKINKLLKDKGYLFVEVPDSTKPEAQIAEFFSFEHLSHFTKRTLSLMLNKCGFYNVVNDSNVNVRNIRYIAQKYDRQNPKFLMHARDKDELVPVIKNYKRERNLMISKIADNIECKLNQLHHQEKKIAIYGAGMHTRFLLDTFEISDIVQCLIDSDPKKTFTKFQQWSVCPPEQIPNLNVDAILISSHDYEEEIFQTIKKYNRNNVMIIRCYEE